MSKNQKISVKNTQVTIFQNSDKDYISLTDIARVKNPDEPKDVVKNWMRSRSTIEYLGLWEKLNNSNFKGVEFDTFRFEAGLNSFVLSPQKWIGKTNAIGIISKSGRYGGTYAHQDIAFEFASWISAEFKLYLIKEFQRLKEEEIEKKKLGWDLKRNLAKINYKIHTDAIKEKLIPNQVTRKQENIIYASEADILNIALFGMTAKGWREKNKGKQGNLRDYATVEQLVCLSNLESMNSVFIKQGKKQGERLRLLNQVAIQQMKSLMGNVGLRERLG